jgi:oxygen-independent coproporphyrinogen-3 oxidase
MTASSCEPRAIDRRRLELLGRYPPAAARYTSYPTAAQFTPKVAGQDHQAWLNSIDPTDPVSVYAHIPMCERLCWYCACNTRAVRRASTVTSYVDALVDELAILEAALPAEPRAASFHLGGGTPNILQLDDLTTLFSAVRHVFRFIPGAEVSAELDPSVLTERWVMAAAHHGLTRASLGVQDLSPEVQAAINRPQPFALVERSVSWLREAGVASVNLDLMYGLPHQTRERLLATVEQSLSLRPDRIALFGYAHVPWLKTHQQLIPEAALPTAAERLVDSELAAEAIVAAGYHRVGMDHFALPDDSLAAAASAGRLHRNFQGYTDDQAPTLIGIGASAISSFPQGYVQNLADERSWRERIGAGQLATARGLILTPEDRLRGEVIERLMCELTADIPSICRAHGADAASLDDSLAALRPMIADGLATSEGRRVSVTDLGRPFIRLIATAFDANAPQAARYSQAV